MDAAAVAPKAGKSSSSGSELFIVFTGGLLIGLLVGLLGGLLGCLLFPDLFLVSSGSVVSFLSSRECLGALLSCAAAALSSCLITAKDALIAAAISLSSSSREYLQLFCPI